MFPCPEINGDGDLKLQTACTMPFFPSQITSAISPTVEGKSVWKEAMKLVLQDPAFWEVEAKTSLSGRSSQREEWKNLETDVSVCL